jgi:hypothetical protein
VTFSRSSISATVNDARARIARAASSGTTPRVAQASTARISTSSHTEKRASSENSSAISGSA